MSFLMNDVSYQALLNYAFRLLATRNYTESEMLSRLDRRASKLHLKGKASATKQVVKRLRELQYLDDQKILADYFEYRLKSRPVGKFGFLHQMHRRGFSFERAKLEWEKRGVDEGMLAEALLEKKRKELDKLPEVLRKKKIMSLLARRGFSPDTTWRILDVGAGA